MLVQRHLRLVMLVYLCIQSRWWSLCGVLEILLFKLMLAQSHRRRLLAYIQASFQLVWRLIVYSIHPVCVLWLWPLQSVQAVAGVLLARLLVLVVEMVVKKSAVWHVALE